MKSSRGERALARAKEAARAERGAPEGFAAPRFLERLTLPVRDGVEVVAASAIDWVGAQDYYSEVHVGGRGYLLRKSLRRLEQELDPRAFARIHRSALVNVARIRSLENASHGERDLLLSDGSDGTRLRVSRLYRDRLMDLLGRS